ncbi:TraM recognition domain-containing protein [Filomicrobium insigne]|uniref:TraM recognition domain-containing protein n=1 Tax=Filomicrobium insigne TaxID=418854 RepID=UPI000B7E2FB5
MRCSKSFIPAIGQRLHKCPSEDGFLAGKIGIFPYLPVWAFVQELSELIRLYGPHTARTVLSQAEVKPLFAVQDEQLTKTLTAALGQNQTSIWAGTTTTRSGKAWAKPASPSCHPMESA